MTTNHGGPIVVTYSCPVSRCNGTMELLPHQKFENATCETCGCPMWPMELGFTGNDRGDIQEFARTHDVDGTFRFVKETGR